MKIKLGRDKQGKFWATPIEYKINYFLLSWLFSTRKWNQDFISPTYLVNIATGHLVQNWAWLVLYRWGYYEKRSVMATFLGMKEPNQVEVWATYELQRLYVFFMKGKIH